jgi:hypothetical protein
MSTKIAFSSSPTIDSWLIRAWTGSEYSHVTLINEGRLIEAVSPDGVVYAPLTRLLDGEWTIIELNDDIDSDLMWQYAQQYIGQPYDYTGLVFSALFGFNFENKMGVYCSELVHKALIHSGMKKTMDSHKTNPGKLYDMLHSQNIVKDEYHWSVV